jgi:MFS family permease
MAVMAREAFDKGAGEYGVLGSIFAVGAVAGSLLAARRSRPRVRLVIGAAVGFGLAAGVSALSPWYWFYAVWGIAVGFATLTLITSANATLQLSTEPQMRGRVMSLYNVVFLGSTPIGSPFVGWVAEAWGPRWSVGVGAIASILIGLGAAIWAKTHWHVEVRLAQLLPLQVDISNPKSDDPPLDPPGSGGPDRGDPPAESPKP